MVGQYDEWAVARTPALLRLGRALTGDAGSAEDAVRRALARTRDDWPRVVRGDPDLEVRRVLVRSCAGRDRAASVLRRVENLSDTEIADVLGCSESAARRHVLRGMDASPGDAMPVSDFDPVGHSLGAGAVAVLERREVDSAQEPRRHGRAVRAAVL